MIRHCSCLEEHIMAEKLMNQLISHYLPLFMKADNTLNLNHYATWFEDWNQTLLVYLNVSDKITWYVTADECSFMDHWRWNSHLISQFFFSPLEHDLTRDPRGDWRETWAPVGPRTCGHPSGQWRFLALNRRNTAIRLPYQTGWCDLLGSHTTASSAR